MSDKSGEKSFSKQFWYIIISICVVLFIIVLIGFIVFGNREEKVISKTETGGNLVLNYTGNNTVLAIEDMPRTTDSVGMKDMTDDVYFDFSVSTELDNAPSIEYELSLIKSKNKKICNISDDDLKVYLEQEKSGTYTKVFGPEKFKGLNKDTKLGSQEGNMVLTKVKKIKKSTDNYRLRIWLSDKSVLEKGSCSVEVVVNGLAK